MTKSKQKLTVAPKPATALARASEPASLPASVSASAPASPSAPDTSHLLAHLPAGDHLAADEGEPTYADVRTAGTPVTPIPQLTRKQAQYVHNVVDKGMSKTEAYIQAYDHQGTRKTAHEEASRTARIPQVKLELAKYSGLAENTVIEVMNMSTEYAREGGKDGAAYAGVALSAAKDVLDRVHGKATQRVEQTSQSVNINIDLTGVS